MRAVRVYRSAAKVAALRVFVQDSDGGQPVLIVRRMFVSLLR
jgi:hypothetical protein